MSSVEMTLTIAVDGTSETFTLKSQTSREPAHLVRGLCEAIKGEVAAWILDRDSLWTPADQQDPR